MRSTKALTAMQSSASFDASAVTAEYLQSLEYDIRSTVNGPTIAGIYWKRLRPIVDGRGELIELWSQPWLQNEPLIIPQHIYQSATDFGVVKSWHLHQHHTDQFVVTRGKLQVLCVDIRPSSSTFRQVNSFILGTNQPSLLVIPPGILHGWKALSFPEVLVINLQSHPYDPDDEFRFPWDCILKDLWEPRFG